MDILNAQQGSAEWHAHRAQHFNASDAPAMMGVSPYKTRAQLVREAATGLRDEPKDAHSQQQFALGHRSEALARPHAEVIVGEDLYPVVGSSGKWSASFDGLTLGEDVVFEHKALNREIRAAFDEIETIAPAYREERAGRCLPIQYRVQMEQQLMVSGAGRALFMASKWNGTELVEERHCWYHSDADLRTRIHDGWQQFERDVASFKVSEPEAVAPVGRAPDTLPALRIEVTGAVTASNLAEFKATALAAIRAVNRDLKTDQDFANADKAVKWCGDVESRLAAAKEHALSQTASIDALFKTIDDISAEARQVRLDLTKLVDKRKVEIKDGMIVKGREAYQAHIAELNEEIEPLRLVLAQPDFAGAAKGKRTFATLQDAVDSELASAKIAADATAREWRSKLAWFGDEAAEHLFLFSDLQALVQKPADDFRLAVTARIEAHKAAEAKKKADAAAAATLAAQTIATASAPRDDRFVPGTRTLAGPATYPPPVAAPAPAPAYTAPAPWDDKPAPSHAAGTDLHQLLEHIATAFSGRFPSHPKPSPEWWADLRAKADRVRAAATA